MIIDENGMYAYVDSSERSSSPQFGPPQKGPRECNGVKVCTFWNHNKNSTITPPGAKLQARQVPLQADQEEPIKGQKEEVRL